MRARLLILIGLTGCIAQNPEPVDPADAGPLDAGAAAVDGGGLDAEVGDVGPLDAALPDGPPPDADPPDVARSDAGPLDMAAPDPADAGEPNLPDMAIDAAPAICGDGGIEGGEACDDGDTLPHDYCAPDCSEVTGACGDGAVQIRLETCDDGNRDDGDACPADCAGPRIDLESGLFEDPLVVPEGHVAVVADGSDLHVGGLTIEASARLVLGADVRLTIAGPVRIAGTAEAPAYITASVPRCGHYDSVRTRGPVEVDIRHAVIEFGHIGLLIDSGSTARIEDTVIRHHCGREPRRPGGGADEVALGLYVGDRVDLQLTRLHIHDIRGGDGIANDVDEYDTTGGQAIGIFAGRAGHLVAHMLTIEQIRGGDGVAYEDAPSASGRGRWGARGGPAVGVFVGDGGRGKWTEARIEDARIGHLYGGGGGPGEMAPALDPIRDPLDGSGGGVGGRATAVAGADALTLDRVVIHDVIGGVGGVGATGAEGGDGAEGRPGRRGGDGGWGGQGGDAFALDPGGACVARNLVIRRLVGGDDGPPGAGGDGGEGGRAAMGGDGGDAGPTAARGEAVVVDGIESTLDLAHLTAYGIAHGRHGLPAAGGPGGRGDLGAGGPAWTGAPGAPSAETPIEDVYALRLDADDRLRGALLVGGPGPVRLAAIDTALGAARVEHVIWWDLDPPRPAAHGPDVFEADALLVDPGADDLRLTAGSPARDALPDSDTVVDISGLPRDALPDIGAYEFVP